MRLCLGAACTECIINGGLCDGFYAVFASALPARSASLISSGPRFRGTPLPRRCLHGVHRESRTIPDYGYSTLPRRCLHGVHRTGWPSSSIPASIFASALPARSASAYSTTTSPGTLLCLGAACTECIYRWFMASQASDNFASALPARSASLTGTGTPSGTGPLPRRCLHGVHQKTQNVDKTGTHLCLGAACTECISY